ncbi:MAG: glycosyltransferase [Solirubrobacterales bacterium]
MRARTIEERPIIQYWHSEEIPDEITELTATFRNLNPDLRHVVFDETGAREFITKHFTAREVAAFDACAVPAMQADYFRYCAVFVLGDIYADVDFRCLRPLSALIEKVSDGLLFRTEPEGSLINGFFLFEASEHPLLRLVLDVATTNIERRIEHRVNVVTGPWIFNGLEILRRVGSIDSARQQAAGAPFERFANSLLTVVSDCARLEEAFENVHILPFDVASNWIGSAGSPLTYRQTDAHWVNWSKSGRGIFR